MNFISEFLLYINFDTERFSNYIIDYYMNKKNPNDMVEELLTLKKKSYGAQPNIMFSKSTSDTVITDLFNIIDVKTSKKNQTNSSSTVPVNAKQEPLTIKDDFVKAKIEE